MGEINLYQYTVSPFTEKVRRVLTYKKLKWHPIECHYADKTNLHKVTKGEWSRVPVLEWDGEVVWNSADIIRWIDQRSPEPRVIPDDARGLCDVIDHWADNTLFPPIMFLVIPDLLDAAGDPALKANREKLIGMSTDKMRAGAGPHQETLDAFCKMIEKQLAHQDFVLGKQFTMADASLYHPFFFLSLNPKQFARIAKFPALMRWYERVRSLE